MVSAWMKSSRFVERSAEEEEVVLVDGGKGLLEK
jgi:hypothetical protein